MVVHSPYITNLANTLNKRVFFWSVVTLKQEMRLMEQIGIRTLVIHPGSSLKASVKEGLDKLIVGLDQVLDSCPSGCIALETMCNKERTGGSFEHLAYVIKNVKQGDRVGICWDTCHLFVAGYDIKHNLEGVIEEFKKNITIEKI